VTHPVFYIDPESLGALAPGDRFELTGDEGHHAKTVKRLGAGEALDLVDGEGRRIVGTVSEILQDGLAITVEEGPERDPRSPVILVQALAKGDRDLMAVEMATELGVRAIVPWQADRSIVRWKQDRAAKAHAKWANTTKAAAKQARRSLVPDVDHLVSTAQLARAVGPEDSMIVLHEQAGQSLLAVLDDLQISRGFSGDGRLFVVVGPEGGIGPEELRSLESVGARTAVLGHDVLRSSTAGAAAIAVINAVTGLWQ
jgi:16S rRNA (uracil1498-N3)-methyltransferase